MFRRQLIIPGADDQDAVQLPAGVTGKDTYTRDTLAVGDVFITIYRNESLTPELVLDCVVKHYVAWTANRPGGRR